MRTLFQLASLALLGLMLFTIAPASAAFFPTPKPTVTAPGSTPCTAICAPTTTIVTEAFVVPPVDPCAPHLTTLPTAPLTQALLLTGVNEPPRVVCGAKATRVDCATPLGNLRDVSEREVRSVDNRDRIKLIPICDRLDASLTQAQVNLGLTGNAESLVPAIARNPVLTAALDRGRYSADDVLGIVMGTDTVMLYVHKK